MTSVAFVFPGQGSQSVGMGQALAAASPAAAAVFAEADAALGEPISAPRLGGPGGASSTGPRTPSRRSSRPRSPTSPPLRERWAAAGHQRPGAAVRGRPLDGPVHRDGRRRRHLASPTASGSSASAAG